MASTDQAAGPAVADGPRARGGLAATAPLTGIRMAAGGSPAGVSATRVTTADVVTTPGVLETRAAAAGDGDSTSGPVPLLFLISDTGGGHRSAAVAVRQALDRAYPGRFAITLCDPLGGPDAAPLLRWVTQLYGPVTRRAPWLWGAAYYLTNSRPAAALLSATLLRLADRPTARAVAARRPAAIVSFHPLTGAAAARARAAPGRLLPVATVVTDLGAAHAAWRHGGADLTIVPPGQGGRADAPPSARRRLTGRARQARASARAGRGGSGRPGRTRDWQAGDDGGLAADMGCVVRAGPPVGQAFWAGPSLAGERAALRRALGLSEDRLLIVLTGGGEGCGGIGRRAAALVRRFADVQVVAVCGRNNRVRRRLLRLAARTGSRRLMVTGYTRRLPDLLRCADLVVTKAGPGTITEAACCGAPLLLTTQLPGQERGNADLVVSAGAGRRVAGVPGLLGEAGRLRTDGAALAGLRAASARLGRPGDTRDIARLIAALARRGPAAGAGPAVLAGSAGEQDRAAVLAGSGTGSSHG